MSRQTVVHSVAAIVLISLMTGGPGCSAARQDKSVIAQANQFNTALQPAEMTNADLNNYLQAIGGRIVAAAAQADKNGYGPKSHKQGDDAWMYKDKQFRLVNSKTLNAFTTGGDYVYIYNELFQLCQNEDELAAVMSHEFGHIYARHVQKGSYRQQALAVAALAAGGAGYLVGGQQNGATYAQAGASAGAGLGQFINMGFSRGDEAQADELGFHFYYLGGWDPRHFGDFFQIMIDKGYDTTPELASDHPTLASRVKIARERATKLGAAWNRYLKPNVATQAQFDALKQVAQRVSQGMPDDQKVLASKQLLQALPRSCVVPTESKDRENALQSLLAKYQAVEKKQQGQ